MAAEVVRAGCWLGLSLGPGRLDAAQLAANEAAFERGMLSSDYVNFLPRDWLAVPRCAFELKRLGADPGFIRRISSDNARSFYRL
jgi:predicted metal-dependent TIM-barrel fold hydrolase